MLSTAIIPSGGIGRHGSSMSVMAMFQQLFGSGDYQYDVARMSLRTKTGSYSFAASATFSTCTLVLTCLLTTAVAGQSPPRRTVNRPSQSTLFVKCHENEKPQRVLSSVALSEGETWSAYVEVKFRVT